MWKSISAALNRLVQKSYDEAGAEKPARASAPTTPAGAVTREELQQKFQQAALLLQAGNQTAAAATVSALVDRAARAQPNGPLHAEALSRQATILAAAGDWPAAETACRTAIAIPAPSDVLRKERLGYQLLLGDVLTHQAKLDEAETLLRDSLTERKTLFGETHANYAAGLSALADLLLIRSRAVEALPLIDEAVRILTAAKHERLPHDLALRAFIIKAASGSDAPALDAWPSLRKDVKKAIAQNCLRRAPASDPQAARAVLVEVLQHMEAEPAHADPGILIAVYIALINAAKALADHQTHIDACRRMVALPDPLPDRTQSAMFQMALAMAFASAGHRDQAEAAWATAAATARQTEQLALMSTVLRNYAVWADTAGLPEQADALYREAVDHGASSGDWSTHGQSTVAYGIFLHRQGRLDEARGLLQEAVAHLPPSHPDLPRAREHLRDLGVTDET